MRSRAHSYRAGLTLEGVDAVARKRFYAVLTVARLERLSCSTAVVWRDQRGREYWMRMRASSTGSSRRASGKARFSSTASGSEGATTGWMPSGRCCWKRHDALRGGDGADSADGRACEESFPGVLGVYVTPNRSPREVGVDGPRRWGDGQGNNAGVTQMSFTETVNHVISLARAMRPPHTIPVRRAKRGGEVERSELRAG
jgi:hypothetical protein